MHPYIRCKGKRTCMVDVDVLSWASASSSASRATCKRCSRSRIRAAESSPPCCCRLSTARVSEWLYHTFIYTKNGVKDKGACRLHEWKVNNIDRLEWLRWYIYVRYTEPHTSVRLTARSRSHASWRAASASCRVNICDARRVISTCNAAFCSSNASSMTEILASNYMSKELVLKAIRLLDWDGERDARNIILLWTVHLWEIELAHTYKHEQTEKENERVRIREGENR